MKIPFMTGIIASTNSTSLKASNQQGESGVSDLTCKQQICLEMYKSGITDLDEIADKADLSHNGTYAILILLEQKGLLKYRKFISNKRKVLYKINKEKCLNLIKSGVVSILEISRVLGLSRSPVYNYITDLCEDGFISYKPKGKNKPSIIKYIGVKL